MTNQQLSEARNKIASFLKDRREEQGLTQFQLAIAVDVKRQTIQKIEYGEFLPNLELFLKILQKLDCDFWINSSSGPDFILNYKPKK